MKPAWHARPVYVAGIAITKWGYLPEVDSHEYGSEAIRGAIADAGFTACAVDVRGYVHLLCRDPLRAEQPDTGLCQLLLQPRQPGQPPPETTCAAAT